MTRDQILAFIKKNPVFGLATSENNAPFVRTMVLFRADENGLVFSTRKSKDVYQQLSDNPVVELCFYGGIMGRQLRVRGVVESVEEVALKKEIVARYPYLKPWIRKEGYEALAVYRLKDGKAVEWTMYTNLAPKVYIRL